MSKDLAIRASSGSTRFFNMFDFCDTLQQDLKRIISKELPIVMYTDSKCLFDTITRLTSISEKRLLIDIAALRQSYSRGELFNIGHISSCYNLADSLTKKVRSNILEEVMQKGTLPHPVNQWIIHHHLSTDDSILVKKKKGECREQEIDTRCSVWFLLTSIRV